MPALAQGRVRCGATISDGPVKCETKACGESGVFQLDWQNSLLLGDVSQNSLVKTLRKTYLTFCCFQNFGSILLDPRLDPILGIKVGYKINYISLQAKSVSHQVSHCQHLPYCPESPGSALAHDYSSPVTENNSLVQKTTYSPRVSSPDVMGIFRPVLSTS